MSKLRLRSEVTIGPLKTEHAASMFSWMQDPIVSDNIGLSRTPSLDKTRAWIDDALQSKSIWPYAIFLNALHVGNAVLDQADLRLASARLSVYIGAGVARSSGVGTTGTYHVLHECFPKRGLNKVWLTVHVRNTPAIRAYTKLGFQVEGVLRDGFLLNSERLPALYMGLLHDEFLRIETELT